MTRPDWASGPEWEGWVYRHLRVHRNTKKYKSFEISQNGGLWVGTSLIFLSSPADALEVANLIAEKLGGWGE